jgi:4'-phosphopantetheinyl transferase
MKSMLSLELEDPAGGAPCPPDFAMPGVPVGAFHASVDVWYVDLDVSSDAVNRCWSCLSPDELDKAARLVSPLERARYIVGHAALRRVVADRLGCSPLAVRFSLRAGGKPTLEGIRGRIDFNLARGGGDAVIALTGRASIGVDLEPLRPIADVERLASYVFSDAERRELALARDPVRAFLAGWTRKQAYVKAIGAGLTAPLKEITVSLSGRAALLSTGVPERPAANWRLLSLPHPRGVVAVALTPRWPRAA